MAWLGSFLSAIWPNIAAEPFVAGLAFVAGWLYRDRLGRWMAAWWDTHHGPHAKARHVEALHEWHAETGEVPPVPSPPPEA